MDEHKKSKETKKYGRRPKKDPAVFRYSISLNTTENDKFLSLFASSGMHVKAHFITACLFQKTIKTVKIDKATLDFYMRLTTLYAEFKAVGVNYNQVVKILYRNFSEKKAGAYLFKLEKQTKDLVAICQKITQLIKEFDAKYLTKEVQ